MPTDKDLKFTKEELDYIQDMAGFYEETSDVDESEIAKYRIIGMKCTELMKRM